MTKLSALLVASIGASASAFTTAPVARRNAFSSTIVFADVAAEEPVATEEPVAAEEPVEEAAAPEPVDLGFCMGMVGSEGPEPVPFFGGTSVDFDPAGFTTRAPEWIPWFREAELKHGRIAMLGALGFVVPEFMRVPGEQFSFEAVPRVVEAYDRLPDSMIQIFGWISLVEACTIPAMAAMDNPRWDRKPGDFSFDPIGLFPEDPEKQKEYQLAELKNGRLAMIALGGMVAGASITGLPFPYISY
jgi:hypothetical protein